MPQKKPKLYSQLANVRDLTRPGGDVLNERRFLRILAQRYDVFYNDQRIDWESRRLGLKNRKVKVPRNNYSLYYIRNNDQVSLSVPGPLLVMAYPYNSELWKRADALLVTTNAWKSSLDEFRLGKRTDEFGHWYPEKVEAIPPVIVAEQYVSDVFSPSVSLPVDWQSEFQFRRMETLRVGFVGRIDPSSFPTDAVEAIESVKNRGIKISLTFLGRINDVQIPSWARARKPIPHLRMPAMMASFDLLLYDQDITGNWLGSAKVLEAMASGVPILVRRQRARVENLGKDYPLFYSSQREIEDLLSRLSSDPKFVKQIREYLVERSRRYRFELVAERFWANMDSTLGAVS